MAHSACRFTLIHDSDQVLVLFSCFLLSILFGIFINFLLIFLFIFIIIKLSIKCLYNIFVSLVLLISYFTFNVRNRENGFFADSLHFNEGLLEGIVVRIELEVVMGLFAH
jgi:energy-coupling factor transporter transmembrane protein EcfT